MSSSQTGGYLLPTFTQTPPAGLTLVQFLQTVIVGISGYPQTLVRPSWQVEPPLMPNFDVDWIAFGINSNTPDAFAYTSLDQNGNYDLSRRKTLELAVIFYGPNSMDNISAFTDGFQLTQNVGSLNSANMGFQNCSRALHVPELINEIWFDRWDMTLTLDIQVERVYKITSFLAAAVTINTVTKNGPYSKNIPVGA